MPDFLQRRVTINEAEADNLYPPGRGTPPIPFGRNHHQWCTFIAKLQDTDELWTFISDQKSWQNLAGRSGYAIVRNGEIVDEFVTLMN